MSRLWVKLHHETWTDARLRKARARAIWPWVLWRASVYDNAIPAHALDPWAVSDDMDGAISEDYARAALAGLLRVGLLALEGETYSLVDPAPLMHDATAADRKRAQRERERATTSPVTNVTRDNRDARDVTPVTVEEIRREQSSSDLQSVDVVVTTPRAHEHTPEPAHTREPPPPPPPPPVDVLEAWRAATGGIFSPPAEVTKLAEMTEKHGPAIVMQAISEAVEGNKEKRVTIRFLRAIVDRLAADGGQHRTAPPQVKEPEYFWAEKREVPKISPEVLAMLDEVCR